MSSRGGSVRLGVQRGVDLVEAGLGDRPGVVHVVVPDDEHALARTRWRFGLRSQAVPVADPLGYRVGVVEVARQPVAVAPAPGGLPGAVAPDHDRQFRHGRPSVLLMRSAAASPGTSAAYPPVACRSFRRASAGSSRAVLCCACGCGRMVGAGGPSPGADGLVRRVCQFGAPSAPGVRRRAVSMAADAVARVFERLPDCFDPPDHAPGLPAVEQCEPDEACNDRDHLDAHGVHAVHDPEPGEAGDDRDQFDAHGVHVRLMVLAVPSVLPSRMRSTVPSACTISQPPGRRAPVAITLMARGPVPAAPSSSVIRCR